MRRKARVDANQKEIVATLRQHGYKVWHLHQVGDGMGDLLVLGYHHKIDWMVLLLVEIKQPGKERDLTDAEKEFHADFNEFSSHAWGPTPLIVASSADDVANWFSRSVI